MQHCGVHKTQQYGEIMKFWTSKFQVLEICHSEIMNMNHKEAYLSLYTFCKLQYK